MMLIFSEAPHEGLFVAPELAQNLVQVQHGWMYRTRAWQYFLSTYVNVSFLVLPETWPAF